MANQTDFELAPSVGNLVIFSDGSSAGKITRLNNEGFVVIKGRKKQRRLVFPYSSVAAIKDTVVKLQKTRAETLNANSIEASDGDLISKKSFIKEIDQRLGLADPERSERIARITLYLFTLRLSQNDKKRFKRSLPFGIRSLWLADEQPECDRLFDMRDFLVPIKNQGRLQSMEEAFIAAREVFSSLKSILPPSDLMEMSRSIPRGLQEIWESAE